jgi:EAL domain-containing protein (putative c-di-GMP-specific phosphodiesterase class I)
MNTNNKTHPALVVIDDEPDLCEFVADVARLEGFSPVAFAGAPEISAIADARPEVIVLDLNMPDMDGVEVLRRCAEWGCEARFILMSGFDRKVLDAANQLALAHKLTVVGILEKPVRAADLQELLRKEVSAPARRRAPPAVTVTEISRAIARGELVLHYQPQVDLATGQCVGVEALVRWEHPQRGLLYPDAFVEIAERNGYSLAMTRWVLEVAVKEWQAVGARLALAGTMAINLPPSALIDVTFPEEVMRLAGRLGVDSTRLQFEMTETSVAADPVVALDILTRLRLKGFGLAIDDFGTGHASLEQLQTLPFDELKIDVNFVRAAETDKRARVITEKSIALGKELGLTVLAEGIENERLWHWLRKEGCDRAQGYFIGHPVPAAEMPAWMEAWRERSKALVA